MLLEAEPVDDQRAALAPPTLVPAPKSKGQSRRSKKRQRAQMSDAELRRTLGRERTDPLWKRDATAAVLDELVLAGERAGMLTGVDRGDVRDAVVSLARAEGLQGTYDAAIDLAARAIGRAAAMRRGGPTYDQAIELAGTALAWATRIRPGARNAIGRDADFEKIPERILEGERLLAEEARADRIAAGIAA